MSVRDTASQESPGVRPVAATIVYAPPEALRRAVDGLTSGVVASGPIRVRKFDVPGKPNPPLRILYLSDHSCLTLERF
jgi:hypothetical protein